MYTYVCTCMCIHTCMHYIHTCCMHAHTHTRKYLYARMFLFECCSLYWATLVRKRGANTIRWHRNRSAFTAWSSSYTICFQRMKHARALHGCLPSRWDSQLAAEGRCKQIFSSRLQGSDAAPLTSVSKEVRLQHCRFHIAPRGDVCAGSSSY